MQHLSTVGQLEILCLLAAVVGIAALVCFTDVAKTPEKLTKAQLQKQAYQKVLEKEQKEALKASGRQGSGSNLTARKVNPAGRDV